MTSIHVNGNDYELARYDLAMAKRINKAQEERDMERRWKSELESVIAAVGKDAVEEATGGTRVAEVDLIALDSLFDAVVAAYEQPRDEGLADLVERRLAGIDVEKMARVLDLAERASSLSDSRQGFNRVV
jgi:hypothetical protein